MNQHLKVKSLLSRISATLVLFALAVSASVSMHVTASVSASVSPVLGGKIVVGVSNTFNGYCLKQLDINSSMSGVRSIAETLFERDSKGKLQGLLLKSAIPEPGNKFWNLEVRTKTDGSPIQFHDGSAWNADALIANFNALRGLTYVAKLNTVGAENLLGTTTGVLLANIVSTVKNSESNVRVELFSPQADVSDLLYASGHMIMRSPGMLADTATCTDTLVGTGPFVLESSALNKLVVTRNQNYWRTDSAGRSLPYLKQITFQNVSEPATRLSRVKSGRLDAAHFDSFTDSRYMKSLSSSNDLSYLKSSQDYYPSLWFNTSIAPFNNVNARKAVSLAIDRKTWARDQGSGVNAPAKSIVGIRNIMYSKNSYPVFSLVKAREFADAYRGETGVPLEFTFPAPSGSGWKSISKAFVAMMKKAGITASFTQKAANEIINGGIFAIETGFQYQAAFLTKFEGREAQFNNAFLLSTMVEPQTTNPMAGLIRLAKIEATLNITKHQDIELDALVRTARFSGIAVDFQKISERVQDMAYITNITDQSFALAASKKLSGLGKAKLSGGKYEAAVSSWGTNWSTVWKSKK